MYERWVVCLIIVTALAGCIDNKEPAVNKTATPTLPPTPPPHVIFPVREPTTVDIKIFASAFDPSVLKVVNGTTVRWTNKDSATYIINVNGFRSPGLNKGANWSYLFNDTGTFEYNCSSHPFIQSGRIIVELPKPSNNS